ncbi:flagellar export protein FliJ [Thiobacter aerophilum]|uniref:Flagellar FliJ protein n=1 Tax=Thiobacter aerophilum TaxID=3121275 RepID=A0ABV0EB21_9BURK
MPRRFPLQSLHDLAADRLEAASRRLAELKRTWQAAEDKLAKLRDYQQEYRQRLGQAVREGLDVTRMRDFHAFLAKIEVAIRHQLAEVERCRQAWEHGQRVWLEERRKLKTYEVLKARHAASERVRENRLEQRDQDEHARRIRAATPHLPRGED